MESRDYMAPENHIWVCSVCGKTSKDKRGDPHSMWDGSCFIYANLIDLNKYELIKDGKYVREIILKDVPS